MNWTPETMAAQAYGALAGAWPENQWMARVAEQAISKLAAHAHGDLPRWLQAIEQLPPTTPSSELDHGLPILGNSIEDQDALRETLMEFHPWRKGPLRLGGVAIDTEWRSDWKWERIAPHLELENQRVLDIGCGNGYFGFRMMAAGAKLVVGIDPTLLFVMQWLACRHFSGAVSNFVLPLGIEDLPRVEAGFDSVFSMGVLYHRKDHLEHLSRIRSLLRPGGKMVLETLVLPGDREHELLIPEGRYAAMRNVWALPGTGRLSSWVDEAGFSDVQLVDVSVTNTDEQRSTDWMRFESLVNALNPENHTLTREGHPAPRRAVMIASA